MEWSSPHSEKNPAATAHAKMKRLDTTIALQGAKIPKLTNTIAAEAISMILNGRRCNFVYSRRLTNVIL
jgi:hypothetical protein